MAREGRKLPLYQRYRDSGALSHNHAGVEAQLKAGDDPESASVTWLVKAATLAGLVPAAGDHLRDTAGRWWTVAAAGAEEGGVYPVTCDRWKDDDE